MVPQPTTVDQPRKPLLRGWLHAVMAPIALILGLTCMIVADSPTVRFGLAIYVLTAVVMFANSALYHRFSWEPEQKAVFRRMDHAFIFTFIAGTYTPLCLTLLHGWDRILLLSLIWTCALAGLLFRILWLSAPRALYVALYVIMGWAAVFWMVPLWREGGPGVVIPLIAGGIVYTVGAVVYGRKSPNPWPTVFGFHEIFHTATIVAAICHFVSILMAVIATL